MSNYLAHSPAEVTQHLLVVLGICSDPEEVDADGTPLESWPVYASNEPSRPDNCVTVYDTVGQSDGRSMIDGETFYHYGIQVRVRGVDHPSGWLKADSIERALGMSVLNTVVTVSDDSSSSVYLVHCFARIGGTLPLGKDAPNTKRSLFTVNALISLRQL